MMEEFSDLGQFLHHVVQACIVDVDCRQLYAKCGYKAEALSVV